MITMAKRPNIGVGRTLSHIGGGAALPRAKDDLELLTKLPGTGSSPSGHDGASGSFVRGS